MATHALISQGFSGRHTRSSRQVGTRSGLFDHYAAKVKIA